MSLVILDYGIGNLRSVQKAFERVGCPASISGDAQVVAEASHLVLPGVGAFGDCMQQFTAAGLHEPVLEHLRHDRPFLGICVGMQMLLTIGHEGGRQAGLDIIEGEVLRFPDLPGFKIPHMGWNQTVCRSSSSFWAGLQHPAWYYFVHSYYCVPSDTSVIALETDYTHRFCSALQRGRLLATQFHPEKSQQPGLALLKRFTEL